MATLNDYGLEEGQRVRHVDDGSVYLAISIRGNGVRYGDVVMVTPLDGGTPRRIAPGKLIPDAGDYAPRRQRILVLDIETRPALAWVWGAYKVYVNPDQIIEDKSTISYAAKWLGDTVALRDGRSELMFASDHHDGHAEMVLKAHALLSEADAVVTFNGDRFDLQHLNTEFVLAGLAPPAPYKSIDVLKTVRSRFSFLTNRLNHVVGELEIGEKMEHEGFDLWTKCMAGDSDAWARMREYNMHDTALTEELYLRVRPWIQSHPSAAALRADVRCPVCGTEELERDGDYVTTTSTYERYQCGGCGAWSRSTRRIDHTTVTQTV